MAKVYDTATDLITFARGSSGTALRRVGYGDELVTDFSTYADQTAFDVDWTRGTGWTFSGGVVSFSNSTGTELSQSLSLPAGVYAVTATASYTGTAPTVYFNSPGITNTVSLSNGTPTTAILAHDGNYSKVTVLGVGNSTVTIDNISVKEVIFDRATDPLVLFNHPDDIPRIEYDGSDGSLKGLLIEEQRSNLVTYSEDINQSFASQTGVSIEPAAATQGPISAAQRMVADTSTGFHRAAGTAPVQNGTDYTFSCFFKADGQDVCGLGVYTGTAFTARASFDLSTVQETVSNGSATIKSVGGGWYHCAVTGTTTGASATVYIYVNSLFGSTGDGTSGVYLYGAQVEAGSFPTSYIPTSGNQKTRDPDLASIPVSAFGYNQDAGTFVADYTPVTKQNQYAISVVPTSGYSDYMALLWGNAGYQVRFQVTVGSETAAQLNTLSNTIAGTQTVHAGAYAANDFAACNDGGTVLTDTLGDVPSGLVQMKIGSEFSNYLNGHIKSLKYYPRRLTNTQLQELTA